MILIENERTKLLATALNNLAVATVVTGFVAPTIGFFYGLPGAAHGHWWFLVAVACFLGGAGLHLAASIVLGKLKA